LLLLHWVFAIIAVFSEMRKSAQSFKSKFNAHHFVPAITLFVSAMQEIHWVHSLYLANLYCHFWHRRTFENLSAATILTHNFINSIHFHFCMYAAYEHFKIRLTIQRSFFLCRNHLKPDQKRCDWFTAKHYICTASHSRIFER